MIFKHLTAFSLLFLFSVSVLNGAAAKESVSHYNAGMNKFTYHNQSHQHINPQLQAIRAERLRAAHMQRKLARQSKISGANVLHLEGAGGTYAPARLQAAHHRVACAQQQGSLQAFAFYQHRLTNELFVTLNLSKPGPVPMEIDYNDF